MRRLNYLTTFMAEGLVIGSDLLAFRLVALFSGPQGFGEYSLSRRTLSLLMPVAVVGVALGVARYVSYAQADKSGKSPGYVAAGLIVLAAAVGIVSAILLVPPVLRGEVISGSRSYRRLG